MSYYYTMLNICGYDVIAISIHDLEEFKIKNNVARLEALIRRAEKNVKVEKMSVEELLKQNIDAKSFYLIFFDEELKDILKHNNVHVEEYYHSKKHAKAYKIIDQHDVYRTLLLLKQLTKKCNNSIF